MHGIAASSAAAALTPDIAFAASRNRVVDSIRFINKKIQNPVASKSLESPNAIHVKERRSSPSSTTLAAFG